MICLRHSFLCPRHDRSSGGHHRSGTRADVWASAIAVAPANSEEVAAVLRFAQENQLAVVPCGGGTKQGWGYPVAPALVLEMHRLNMLREHTWQDMTCTVEAGCTWSAMQSGLAQHGQYVALDPLWPERATVGGIVATNDSGALRLRYGGLRDLIIGMTIVLADGTIAHTGGKVVKNVAGYDLHKLMIGAFGTLGVDYFCKLPLALYAAVHAEFYRVCAGCRTAGQVDAQVAPRAAQHGGDPAAGHGGGIRSRYPTRIAGRGAAYTGRCAGGRWRRAKVLLHGAPGMRFGMPGKQQLDRDIVCKGTMLPAEIARFAERVRGLGGESVTQATGIMIAGFPAAAAEGLLELRRELEDASGSLMVLKQPAESEARLLGNSAG